MQTDIEQSSRRGMSRGTFIVGLALWAVVVAFGIHSLLKPAPIDRSTAQSDAPPSDGPQKAVGAANDQKSDSDAVMPTEEDLSPAAVVLSPSEDSIRIGFPTRELPDFSFDECMGGKLSRDDLRGKPWVASFVFTRCITTCPVISRHVMELQKKVSKVNTEVRFVTFTVDPKFDTVEVLQKYSEIFSADHERWKFVTGEQEAIMDVVVGGFGQVVIPSVGENLKPGFEVAHSNRVVLVNEDCIPVATFLATREEDMVQLRRILEGKKPFPEPSSISGITIGSPQAPINLEIRKADSNPESATDSVAETPAEEDANAVEASEQKESDETPEGQTSLLRSSRRDWDVPRDAILTAVWLQDPAQDAVLSSDSNPDTSATNEHSFNQTDPEPTDDGGPPTKSVESNNDRITRLMPAWAAALPDINAGLNLASTVLLLSGFVSIKRKNQTLHRNLMISAFVLSVAFLGFYLTYHYALGKYTETYGRQFVGSEMARVVYRSILIPHVILAVFVPILAIRVFQHAFAGRWDKHRKLATITFPIWLFVSVTGVVIYWMLYRWN